MGFILTEYKTKKKLCFLMMAVFFLGMTACSDDDEEGIAGDAKTLIVGTWESTWSKGYEIYEGEKEEWDEAYTEDVYTFKNDGSGTYKDVSGSTPYTEDFTWSISGNKLKITFNGYSDEATIKTLNGTTLVIIAQEKDENEEFYDEISFKKKSCRQFFTMSASWVYSFP